MLGDGMFDFVNDLFGIPPSYPDVSEDSSDRGVKSRGRRSSD